MQFQYITEDEAALDADAVIGCPDELPKHFWARYGMLIFPRVMVLNSWRGHRSVDFGVLTDGKRDWWYQVGNTNVVFGYETGRSTPATMTSRRKALLSYADNAENYLHPDHLATSLSGDDLKWLRSAQQLPVVYKPGTLRHL